jgi:hypothetical protein
LLNKAASAAGLPNPENVVPATPGQASLGAGMAGATSMAPFGPLGGVAGFVGGVIGHRAGEVVPEYLRPMAEMLGNYAGQMGFYGAGTAGHYLGRTANDAFQTARGPIGGGTPQPVVDPQTGRTLTAALPSASGAPIVATPRDIAAVGSTMAERAGMSLADLATTIQNAPASPVGVQPTVPTTVAEATKSPLLLAYQKQVMNASPDAQAAFDARHAQNVLAIVNSLKSAAPEDVGEATGSYLKAHLNALTATADANNAMASQRAAGTLQTTGLTTPWVAPLTAQAYGNQAREQLTAAQQRDYAAEQAAFDAMPGNLAVNMAPLGSFSQNMLSTEPGPGGAFHPAEAKLYNDTASMSGVVPFDQVRQLLRNTSAAKRQITTDLGSENPAYGRVSQFQGALTDALGDAADRGAEADAGNPMGQRVSDQVANLPVPKRQPTVLPSGAIFDPDKMATAGRVQPEPPPTENFTPAVREMWRDRNQAYAIYKDKWRTGTMGDVLRPTARYLGFKVPASEVGDWLFDRGSKGAEAADDLIKALGSRESALALIGEYPALILRNAAMRDGVLDPGRYEAWKRAYAPVLAKFPEIADKFDTAANAQRMVEEAAAHGKKVVDDFQGSAASRYLTKDGTPVDPQVAVASIMSSRNPTLTARDLIERIGGDRAALDGIRRNVIDWLLTKMTMRSELGLTGQLDTSVAQLNSVLRDPKQTHALEEILTPQQMRQVRGTQDQLSQLARAWNAIKLRASPGTAMDLIRAGFEQKGFQGFSHLMAMVLALRLMEEYGPKGLLLGGAVEAGTIALNALRSAGIKTQADLMAEAMLNPAFGRIAAEKAAESPRSPINKLSVRRMIESLIGTAQTTQSQAERRVQAGARQ